VIRRVSPAGRELIKRHEGLRLEAYPDPASGGDPWTIGYGHTHGVKRGDRITAEQADAFLAYDLAWVEEAIAESVKVPISQGQFDGLASLIFNIGAGAFKSSTLLRRLNAGDHIGAAGQFERWVNAAGKRMPGLVKRRAEEAALFRAGMSAPPAPISAPTAPPAPSAPLVQPGPEPADYYAPSGEAPEWVPPPPPKSKEPVMAPFVAAALPAIVQSIPQLAKLFGSGSEVAQRNVAAAETVVGIVQQAVGASNAQEAAELVQSDPQARQKARQAIEAQWYTLAEAGGGGIDGARKADAAARAADTPWWGVLRSPSFIVAMALLPLVYMIVGNVVGLWGEALSDDVRSAIANGIPMLILGGLIGYYYGQTTSRNRTPQ
jgi:lysozyme